MASNVDETDLLSKLPLDLITDNILPLLPTSTVLNLAATSRSYHRFVTGIECETVWQRRCSREFHFPVRQSGRRRGWLILYQRLSKSSTWVWGSKDNGRMGLAGSEGRLRERIISGGLVVPTRLQLGMSIVALAAAGWSFHALTSEGYIISWGTFDGGQFVMGNAPLSNPGRIIQQPMAHPNRPEMEEVVDLKAGRGHVLAKSWSGKVYEFRCLGRTAQICDSEGRWGRASHSDQDAVVAIEAGWEHSLVLTRAGDAFIWWQSGPGTIAEAAKAVGESRLTDATCQGVLFPLEVESVRLPDLPDATEGERIRLIASGDTFVIALTTLSRLFFLDVSNVPDRAGQLGHAGSDEPDDSPDRSRASRERLAMAFLSGQRGWRPMTRFYEADQFQSLDGFRESKPPASTRITHISAHFKSFFAYSVPADSNLDSSVVLQGNDEWTENVDPIVVPELQHCSVIKVAQGDYHNLALTSDGHVLSWGSFSSGALGLGHPQLSNTPLSVEQSHWSTSTSITAGNDVPPPRAHPGEPGVRFPGFVRTRPVQPLPPPPDKVETPMLIRFPGDVDETLTELDVDLKKEGKRRTQGKFVFEVTAGGWHSGALAVEIGDGGVDDDGPIIKSTLPVQTDSAGFDRVPEGIEPGQHQPRGIFRGGVFRIGFAGRGMRRNLNPEQ
ncbi:hypothetical protein OIV83_004388 [Microbotryomycetes sp. JL201]|nr:hypothetical protein OIV83_004388 [Microbotryomycetes sp. JL201]